MHDASASLLRTIMVLIDHFANPLNLTREVAVGGTRIDASLDEV